jgi:hypothetical protein
MDNYSDLFNKSLLDKGVATRSRPSDRERSRRSILPRTRTARPLDPEALAPGNLSSEPVMFTFSTRSTNLTSVSPVIPSGRTVSSNAASTEDVREQEVPRIDNLPVHMKANEDSSDSEDTIVPPPLGYPSKKLPEQSRHQSARVQESARLQARKSVRFQLPPQNTPAQTETSRGKRPQRSNRADQKAAQIL